MGTRDILTLLQQAPVFAGCSEAFIDDLLYVCRVRRLGKGQIIFLQLDTPDHVYIVRSGAILISITSEDGRELVLNEMLPGDLFGELSILTGETRSADAIARVRSQVLVIPSDFFLQVLETEPTLSRRLMELMAHRLRQSTHREGALAFLDAQARVARLLLELNAEVGEKGYITLTQFELAQRLGLARQTVAKILGKWRRAGWLITGRGRIMILRIDALDEIERRPLQ